MKESTLNDEVIGRTYKMDISSKEPSVAGMGPEKLFPTRLLHRDTSQFICPNMHYKIQVNTSITDYRCVPDKSNNFD